ncbi:glycosyltransferase family 2 protein [Sphingomonas sp. MMS24-J13]|uniref:glycosyltransferase family 2 protein n=1 Tax=Sphingomonas sp. MMS24-J13 TaxID=3238686 RepID=UPI00384D7109
MIRLAIVVPCYNEEKALPVTVRRLGQLLADLAGAGKIAATSGVWLIDDGSADGTWTLIRETAGKDPRFHGVKLSRNRGHQNALLAGLDAAEGDAIVTIDADLQDDTSVIEKMVDLNAAGIDIVYGVRRSRTADSAFKRATAESYYRILGFMGVQIVFNHADYRLMSRRAIAALERFTEVNLFLRGIVPQLGFATATVAYDRHERTAGESKYPVRRMISLAIDGITSFSVVPLRMIAAVGIMVCLFSVAAISWVLYGKIFRGDVLPGWASSVIPIYLLGGVQLFSIGVIGEYVGKIYLETKRRPRFFIEERADGAEDQAGLDASRQNSL